MTAPRRKSHRELDAGLQLLSTLLIAMEPNVAHDEAMRILRGITDLGDPDQLAHRPDRFEVLCRMLGASHVLARVEALLDDPRVERMLAEPEGEAATHIHRRCDVCDLRHDPDERCPQEVL